MPTPMLTHKACLASPPRHPLCCRYDPLSLQEFEAYHELLVGVLRISDQLQADTVMAVSGCRGSLAHWHLF